MKCFNQILSKLKGFWLLYFALLTLLDWYCQGNPVAHLPVLLLFSLGLAISTLMIP